METGTPSVFEFAIKYGWLLLAALTTYVFKGLRLLHDRVSNVKDSVNDLKVNTAKEYTPREEYRQDIRDIKDAFNSGINRIEKKMDHGMSRIEAKIDNKADK